MDAVLETRREKDSASVGAVLQTMREAARRAPSGDNVQPWRLEVVSDRLNIHLDAARDPSPMNAGQRMSLLACGAAAESARVAAHASGWNTQVDVGPTSEAATLAVSVRLAGRAALPADFTVEQIHARVTNRRMYDGRELSTDALTQIRSRVRSVPGIGIHWVCERERLRRFSDLIARSDAVFFGNIAIRRAFLKNVRFDLPPTAEAEEGLPLGALELSVADQMALRSLKFVPSPLFRMTGGSALFARHARKVIRSSSGLCIVTVDENCSNPEISAGQAALKVWLSLSSNGLAVQPMMTWVGIENLLRYGPPDLVSAFSAESRELLEQLGAELRDMRINGRTMFLLRFGYARAPSGRTGRLNRHA